MNGEAFRLVSGDYTASIVQRGGALRQLTFQGRDLVVPFDAKAPIPDYRGIIAAPWPNRIADGSYRHDGAVLHLPLNEPARRTALHGLVFDQLWTFQAGSTDSLRLSCELGDSAGYPFRLALQLDYRLDAEGLHTTVTARNLGERTAPYGVCPHPYLLAGPAPLDEWLLELHAGSFLKVTADRLLPLGMLPVADREFDFRAPRTIGATEIDHAFTDIAHDDDGRAQLIVRDPSGTGAGMSWDRSCPWVQIHTADKPAPLPNRLGLAVEPMTCPPDAFNSGQDLIQLEPGSVHEAQWSIFAD
ncbi:aldose 1-epimerase family protein [Arthrobacter sp. MI7-26]|uniref:aldose 1-epimerase family protein n=1 Tax=Arthrobacter sp. MI7-26 TaxID=2993653 RepID=UPI002248F828|nr:aldose 1-epimerase family protein [Arthrobacter sp. MI7-26]MCX2748751.1 aldose 1-epimerase family protein [Arthrobacter sp. MI7-26]